MYVYGSLFRLLLPAADLSVTVHARTHVRDVLDLRACESMKIAAATCNLP